MIEAALDSNNDVLDSLLPPNQADSNYLIALTHHSKAKVAAAEIHNTESTKYSWKCQSSSDISRGQQQISFIPRGRSCEYNCMLHSHNQ
jgi:hypothetical protein